MDRTGHRLDDVAETTYHLPTKGEGARLTQLLQRLQPSIAGLKCSAVYSAVCRDAMETGNPLVIVAETQEGLVGCVLAVVDWRRYWRSFLVRYPPLAGEIAARRLSICLGRAGLRGGAPNGGIRPLVRGSPQGISWKDSGPEIAKVLFIGVLDRFRRRGIGSQLYATLLPALWERGVARIDACIDAHNFPSARMHSQNGWWLSRSTGCYFATRETTC